jgi:anti-sigma factor RsiW
LNEHLSMAELNALADGELSGEQLAQVNEHLTACPQCTANALRQSLLKTATARAGQRYAPPAELRDRLTRLTSREGGRVQSRSSGSAWGASSYGWAAVAAVLLVSVGLFFAQYGARRSAYAGLMTEASDQHIAMLAVNAPPEVISTDRHTVKPWFQGKIPFSFNLPQNLPADVTLDGANLTYLHGQPTAQLLYSIGKHRVSVFAQQRTEAAVANGAMMNRAGFHLASFRTDDLQVVAVSDVDEARLSDLMNRIETSQTGR